MLKYKGKDFPVYTFLVDSETKCTFADIEKRYSHILPFLFGYKCLRTNDQKRQSSYLKRYD